MVRGQDTSGNKSFTIIYNLSDIELQVPGTLLKNDPEYLLIQNPYFIMEFVKESYKKGFTINDWIFDIGDKLILMEQVVNLGFTKIKADLKGGYLELFLNKAKELNIEVYA